MELIFKTGGDTAGSCNPGWGYMVALDKKTNKRIGFIDFSSEDGITTVQMIEVHPDHRGKGVGIQLLDSLQAESGDRALEFGSNTTTEAFQELLMKWERRKEEK